MLRERAEKLALAANLLNAQADASLRDKIPFRLVFMTDLARAPEQEEILRILPENSAVIFRDYRVSDRGDLAARYQEICKDRRVKFIVGADVALAKTLEADGFHVPSFYRREFEKAAWPGFTTAACHGVDDLKEAQSLGATAALLSPAFSTESHPGQKPLGTAPFKEAARQSPIPVFALGGITASNAAQLAGPKTIGFAAISAFAL